MPAALVLLLFATVGAIELTTVTLDAVTLGTAMFVKLHAPWCDHCEKMKPGWALSNDRSQCQLSVPSSPSPPMSDSDDDPPSVRKFY